MKLRKLQLENFRNYNRHEYEFPEDKKITILVGPNGKGKTNFLEAIYVLSLGKSFRTILQDDLIEWKFEYMRCKCKTEIDGEETSLEVFYSNYPRKQKGFKKNDVSMKNSEYIGNLITVLFHPEDLNMLYLSPSYRRKYLNILLSQVDKKYLEALSKYKKTLKQRNALLHAIREAKFTNKPMDNLEKDLNAWDTEIMEFGSMIIKKRVEFTQFLNKNLEKIYQSISSGKEKVEIKYHTIKGEYEAELIVRRNRDIREAKTTLGPHRDDLKFFIDNKEILSSASRGEFRTLLLAIKLAEIKFIKEKTGRNPILLLDDVFSELDRKRGEHLLKSIKDCQTIITTTDRKSFEKLDKEGENLRFVKIG
ncbi:MAG: DNA replication/repair protein RecF [Nitrospirae bacterium]|nr:DNA replication/repair protein RecF [Nitrospirota bacterium]